MPKYHHHSDHLTIARRRLNRAIRWQCGQGAGAGRTRIPIGLVSANMVISTYDQPSEAKKPESAEDEAAVCAARKRKEYDRDRDADGGACAVRLDGSRHKHKIN